MATSLSLTTIVSYLDNLLQVARYDEGEPANGLMVDAGRPVTRLAAAVNTSFESIRGAAECGAELLLVHHAIFESIDHALKLQKEAALKDAGVSLYGAHAALDCHPEFSNSEVLARQLGVRVLGRFVPYCGGLAGAYGEIDGPFEQFVERVRELVGTPVAAWKNADTFSRIGIVAGGGGWTSYLAEAQSLGCDTYLTGEGSMYTKLYAREAGMNLVMATHYATETGGIRALAAHLAERFSLPWDFITEVPE
jgi:dinuclear metal center YbgI/SA1388 family protein